jgi:malonate decarboxylase gamma subunit
VDTRVYAMSVESNLGAQSSPSSRGRIWFDALTGGAAVSLSNLRSVCVADAALGGETARFLAVVPDAQNRFPRARAGEVGLDEGWALAHHVRAPIAENNDGARRPIIAIVDVSSQAYGRREELLGIHLACAAAADAYASARLAGHPVIALLVGKAMSGAFLAHGYQANRIIALDSREVMVQAMGKQAAARVTRSSVEEMEKLGERIAPVAYDIRSYASLGLLHKLIEGIDADAPSRIDLDRVRAELVDAITDARAGAFDLACRLTSPAARKTRAASIEVRRRLAEQWRSPEQGPPAEPGDVRL